MLHLPGVAGRTRPAIFKWRQTELVLILISLSLRDVEELLKERGLEVDHTTVWHWVQRYGPELEQRLRRHLKPTNKSWRVARCATAAPAASRTGSIWSRAIHTETPASTGTPFFAQPHSGGSCLRFLNFGHCELSHPVCFRRHGSWITPDLARQRHSAPNRRVDHTTVPRVPDVRSSVSLRHPRS